MFVQLEKELCFDEIEYEETQMDAFYARKMLKYQKDEDEASQASSEPTFDEETSKIFQYVDPGKGESVLSIMPWLGAIREPKRHLPINPEKPNFTYEIDFVYGYKTEEARQNCFYNLNGCPVYMTAAMGVIYDPLAHTQKIFGGGETEEMIRKQDDHSYLYHNDDIMCLAMNKQRDLVATGQVGFKPLVFVWSAITAEKLAHYELPKRAIGVTAIAINCTSELIAFADYSNDHYIYCIRWKTGDLVFKNKTGCNKIFMIDWNLTVENHFVSIGPKHTLFWNFNQGQIQGIVKPRGGVFGTQEPTNFTSVTHDLEGSAYSGGQNGKIYKIILLESQQIFNKVQEKWCKHKQHLTTIKAVKSRCLEQQAKASCCSQQPWNGYYKRSSTWQNN